jgi:hypothetical protein
VLFAVLPVTAQESGSNSAAQANNPLANMTAFNVQQYFIGELTESDRNANQFWLRYAKPFAIAETKWLLRASLPINSYPVGANGGTETGLSDLNLFAAWLIDTGNPAVSFGLGPQLTLPTATEDALGSEKWSAGLVNVLFNAKSHVLQYGYLLSWQGSFAGNSDRSDVNVAAFQPFVFFQLGHGAYLRGAPIWVYNLDNDHYSVPLGVGIGQVIKQGKTVYNVFAESQFSVADKGAAQPEWQLFMGLNMQFLN